MVGGGGERAPGRVKKWRPVVLSHRLPSFPSLSFSPPQLLVGSSQDSIRVFLVSVCNSL